MLTIWKIYIIVKVVYWQIKTELLFLNIHFLKTLLVGYLLFSQKHCEIVKFMGGKLAKIILVPYIHSYFVVHKHLSSDQKNSDKCALMTVYYLYVYISCRASGSVTPS